MTQKNQKQPQQGQPPEPQGMGVSMKYLLESYMQQTVTLTKENLMLKAYINQLESENAAANSKIPENGQGQPAN